MISLKRYTKTRFLVMACYCITFLPACSHKTFTINIPSTFKGYVYVISSVGTQDKNLAQLDSTGVVYLADYCKDEVVLNISVDGGPLKPEPGYLERHQASGTHNGKSFSVTYMTFLFPLQAKKDYSNEDQPIEKLFDSGKLDIMRVKSCE